MVTGLAALGSGFLAAVTQVAADAPTAARLRLGPLALGQVPTWPWYIITPLLMTATFLAIRRAHDQRARDQGADHDRPDP